jgi:Uma2 family endonuclease
MATKPLVSADEYLRMSFEGPDREYLDGEVVERNVGEKDHSKIQKRLIGAILRLEESRRLFGFPELRLKLGPQRYRIPDVCIFAEAEPDEPVPSICPLAVIEIVSPDDRLTDVVQKLEEYYNWGVRHVWLADPTARKLFAYSGVMLQQVPAFRIPEYDLDIPASELFR